MLGLGGSSQCCCIKAFVLAQFRDEAEAAGKLLPARHPVSRAVREVGLRIAAVAQEDIDGQPIKHMQVQHRSSILPLHEQVARKSHSNLGIRLHVIDETIEAAAFLSQGCPCNPPLRS